MNLLLLLKKDFSFFGSGKKARRHDMLGSISTFVLLALLYGTFIYVFYSFSKTYLNATFQVAEAAKDRAYELMTFVYVGLLLINVIVGVKQIYSALVSSNDCDVLLCQPISQQELFLYKIIKIYGAQVVSTLLILLPCAVVIDILCGYVGGFLYYFTIFCHLILCPLAGCAISSLIALPFNGVMQFVERKFVLHLVLYVVVLGVGFFFYGKFLSLLTGLIQSGELKYLLDIERVHTISSVANHLYPFKFFSDMLFGKNVLISLISVLGICLLSGVVSYFVIKAMYIKILQIKLEGEQKIYYKKSKITACSPLFALLKKEFIIILRTPSYAFSYFATTFTLPFMVYVCSNLLSSMLSTIPNIALIECNYEIAIFVIAMFSVLTNTFCTTNISRDGKMFAMLKTMPVGGDLIVKAKLLFCLIVSEISVLVSSLVLLISGFINPWQALVIFILASLLGIAEIAFATRRDLNKPNLPNNDRDEVIEDNNNISTVMIIGLVIAILLGGGALLMSLVLSLLYTKTVAIIATLAFLFVAVGIVLALSLVYLFKGLKLKFYQSEE